VDDLQAIAFIQVGIAPLIAGNDLAIQFDSNAVSLHPETFDKRRQVEWSGCIEIPRFAIDCEFHDSNGGLVVTTSLVGFPKNKLPSRRAAFIVGLDKQRRIGQNGLFHFDLDFGRAAGICYGLRVKRN